MPYIFFTGLAKSYRKPDVPKIAVFNADDPGSYAYLQSIPVQRQVVYGLESGAADVTAQDARFSPAGLRFTLDSPWGRADIHSTLVGTFNVSNILAAASSAFRLLATWQP